MYSLSRNPQTIVARHGLAGGGLVRSKRVIEEVEKETGGEEEKRRARGKGGGEGSGRPWTRLVLRVPPDTGRQAPDRSGPPPRARAPAPPPSRPRPAPRLPPPPSLPTFLGAVTRPQPAGSPDRTGSPAGGARHACRGRVLPRIEAWPATLYPATQVDVRGGAIRDGSVRRRRRQRPSGAERDGRRGRAGRGGGRRRRCHGRGPVRNQRRGAGNHHRGHKISEVYSIRTPTVSRLKTSKKNRVSDSLSAEGQRVAAGRRRTQQA